MYGLKALIFDIIVVAIILITAWMSSKRGFVRTVIEVAGCVLALIISVYASKPVAEFCYNRFFANSVENSVKGALDDVKTDSASAVWDSLPEYLKKYAESFGITKEKIDDAASKATDDKTEEISDQIAESTVKPVVVKALSGVISAAMFAILFFLIKILSRLINGMFNISFVGSINRLLGGLLGLVKGMIFAALFILIINFIVVISKGGISVLSEDMINESIFFKLFSNLIK